MNINAAFTVWGGRIAPVFDVAHRADLVIWDPEQDMICSRTTLELAGETAPPKLKLLREQQVQVLVCGAICRQDVAEAEALGIKVIPFVAGNIDEIIAAWTRGTLEQEDLYRMPGYCNRNRRRIHRRRHCRYLIDN